jgi:hypothetical protein
MTGTSLGFLLFLLVPLSSKSALENRYFKEKPVAVPTFGEYP